MGWISWLNSKVWTLRIWAKRSIVLS
jgi:hypothetical protein